MAEPVPQKDRAYPARIDETDRVVIAETVTAGRAGGHSVDHAFASAWDEGVMLASRRTWWRIASAIEDQSTRPPRPAAELRHLGKRRCW